MIVSYDGRLLFRSSYGWSVPGAVRRNVASRARPPSRAERRKCSAADGNVPETGDTHFAIVRKATVSFDRWGECLCIMYVCTQSADEPALQLNRFNTMKYKALRDF